MTAPALVEHFFRHEYGKLVANLSRRVGVNHLQQTEDAVQSALMAALEQWPSTGAPDRPEAWLYRVAYNHLMDRLRQASNHRQLLKQHAKPLVEVANNPPPPLPAELQDDLLRMLFVCCDEQIPLPSRLVFALKTLCGFGVREIALALFTSEANVYKRLSRARTILQNQPDCLALSPDGYPPRLDAVQGVLYLLFTEGYLSCQPDATIRRELCEEAIRLTGLLADHPAGKQPRTAALLALMHLHMARMPARQDSHGGLLLLEEQDRARWDQPRIREGLAWLAQSAHGKQFSRYHAEAGIAAAHCLAPTFAQTDWQQVVSCYELLEQAAPSALHRLNRAVAVAEWRGPAAGLDVLDGTAPPDWLTSSYLWAAVRADLHRRCGHISQAEQYRRKALELAPTKAVQALLKRRLKSPPVA